MKVKALINVSYKGTTYAEGEFFDMTKEDFKNVNKNYVEEVPEPKINFKKENEGVITDG